MSSYTIHYERDNSRWVASVKELSGCHTQGHTIAQARVRIREALGLFVDDSETAELIDDISLAAEEDKKRIQ
jgi:predicted RNase H-like HicB family nuclease